MLSFPNAKINLGLNIIAKRPDGYHNIESIFYPVGLKDGLEFVESTTSETTMQLSNIQVDGDISNNLVIKAYRLLATDFKLPPLQIYLQKNIPFGAGLGGGSADAAFMLRMLNEYFKSDLSTGQLENYAAQLGADCPFFIRNKPAFVQGTGTIFEDINISLKGFYIIIIKPNIYIPTPEAYAGCLPQKPQRNLREIATLPIEQWRETMHNDFEKTVFTKYPQIAEIKQKLYDTGAVYASMSGSGSAVFGIFREKTDLKAVFAGRFVWSGELE
ncbi:MAG: 4-(cytidine 5'-diphospho)-2-C-methyl-D-erythritol kinase [Prevotellaceae bacterium]|jgi:4-diphosphocytidyl-2-C-methyl-D-erythritol kinase|nr:4-(cytidine 5'-diphospho)-2-C-methyl-D-erythritol kinase [Prevotellaceae bacterium]